jgi:hypothetical protein
MYLAKSILVNWNMACAGFIPDINTLTHMKKMGLTPALPHPQ